MEFRNGLGLALAAEQHALVAELARHINRLLHFGNGYDGAHAVLHRRGHHAGCTQHVHHDHHTVSQVLLHRSCRCIEFNRHVQSPFWSTQIIPQKPHLARESANFAGFVPFFSSKKLPIPLFLGTPPPSASFSSADAQRRYDHSYRHGNQCAGQQPTWCAPFCRSQIERQHIQNGFRRAHHCGSHAGGAAVRAGDL